MSVTLKKSRALGMLNLTPLIDVVFLLLIFFLVATRFEEQERELDIVLPSATQAKPLISRAHELFINIDEHGRYTVNGKLLSARELEQGLAQAAADNPGRQPVIIRADRRCFWEFVVVAMDLCNKAQIRDYRVTTLDGDPAAAPPSGD
jgi:biopolymer transport protein ExbD